MKIHARIAGGGLNGGTGTPHRHADGTDAISPTRLLRVPTLEEAAAHIRRALSCPMSSSRAKRVWNR